jgi:hypothetical protein
LHVLSLPPAFVLSQDQTLKFDAKLLSTQCTFCLIDEDTHLSTRSENRAIGSVPLKKTCTHRSRSIDLLTRFASSFRSARTSPSTFLFLPSSQCQRADPYPLRDATSGGSTRSQNFSNRTSPPVARQQACPVRNRRPWEQLAQRRQRWRVIVKTSKSVNTQF